MMNDEWRIFRICDFGFLGRIFHIVRDIVHIVSRLQIQTHIQTAIFLAAMMPYLLQS